MPVSAAAQVYGRQGGLPAAVATPLTPQGPIGDGVVVPSPTLTAPDVPVAAAPASSPAAPSASLAAPSSANAAVAPALATAAGETSPTVAATTVVSAVPLPPVVGSAREGAAVAPAQAMLAGGQEVHQVPSTGSGATPASLSPPVLPATPVMPTAVGQLADPLAPVSGSMARSQPRHPRYRRPIRQKHKYQLNRRRCPRRFRPPTHRRRRARSRHGRRAGHSPPLYRRLFLPHRPDRLRRPCIPYHLLRPPRSVAKWPALAPPVIEPSLCPPPSRPYRTPHQSRRRCE